MADNCEENTPVISIGNYVIVNRNGYNKLHLLTKKSVIYLGKDKVNLEGIVGHAFWSTFKMTKGSKQEYTLSLCDQNEIVKAGEFLKTTASGEDNRNITDDGNSQLLSTEEIIELRDSGLSSQKIVGQLIENSKTFHNKTEYSQQKYLKKKGEKYFEYLTIKMPTLRLLSEILLFAKDHSKGIGLRIDSISQLVTSINLQPDGKYILYENGSQGLVAATVLNYLSEGGKLMHVMPGKHPQQHAILAMNFGKEQLGRLKSIQLSTLLQKLAMEVKNKVACNSSGKEPCAVNASNIQDTSNNDAFNVNSVADKTDGGESQNDVVLQTDCETEKGVDSTCTEKTFAVDVKRVGSSNTFDINSVVDTAVVKSEHGIQVCEEKANDNASQVNQDNNRKRKKESDSDNELSVMKKPRWEIEAEEIFTFLQSQSCDGVIITCKEHPSNLLKTFLQFLTPSRPFVVFNFYREPLMELYVDLYKRHDVINLRLTETWMRSYQVLPDRTHPDVLMSGNSGYLLTGIVVDNK